MANLNIVYLDEYSMGGRDVTPLRRLGNYTGYERTAPEQTCERCAEADVVITNKVVFDAATLDRFERTNPQNFHTWKLLGEYYLSQGDDGRAAQSFGKALEAGVPRRDELLAIERLKSECKP